MRWALLDLDGDVRLGPPQRRDMLSCLERVHLAGARLPTQVWLFSHATAYPAVPSSRRKPFVNMVRPGRVVAASALALASSSRSSSASRVSSSSSKSVLSILPEHERSLRPSAVGVRMAFLAW